MSPDDEENISDEDEALAAIEDIAAGDNGVIEVVMGEGQAEDEEMDEDDEEGPSGDESSENHDQHHQLEIMDEDGNPIDDDGASGWESESAAHVDEEEDGDEEDEDDDVEEIDYEAAAQDLDEEDHVHNILQMAPDDLALEIGAFTTENYLDEEAGEDGESFLQRYFWPLLYAVPDSLTLYGIEDEGGRGGGGGN